MELERLKGMSSPHGTSDRVNKSIHKSCTKVLGENGIFWLIKKQNNLLLSLYRAGIEQMWFFVV